MGYNNCIPGWMLEEILKEQAERARKQKGIKLSARIITGNAEYVRDCPNEWRKTLPKICCETMNQLESEQYILSKGFVRVNAA